MKRVKRRFATISVGSSGGHEGPQYERLKQNGDIALQLQSWNAHERRNLGDPDAAAQLGSAG